MVFRNIVLSAVVVGIISGVLYGVFQQAGISPIIYAAEGYEVSDDATASGHAHVHDDGVVHAHDGWAPADGAERIAYTYGANILTGIAFAIFLISLMALHNYKSTKPPVDAGRGALWGIAALVTVFVAPALFGLHPEVPGTQAAALDSRQAWWVFCVASTGAGIAALYYLPALFKLIGAVLVAAPHAVGAPHPAGGLDFANTDPNAVAALTELSQQFFWMTAAGMAIFCLLLGVLSGYATSRFVDLRAAA